MAKADAVRDACHKNGTLYNSGLLRRFNNQNHMIRKRIEDGDIGEVGGAVHLGRSSLMHGHIHSIDTLSYLLGDPKVTAVRGDLLPRDLKIEDNRLDADPDSTRSGLCLAFFLFATSRYSPPEGSGTRSRP